MKRGVSASKPLRRSISWNGAMTKIVYRIVEHDEGWAYQVDGVFSETFPSHDAAPRGATRRRRTAHAGGDAQHFLG